MLILRLYIFKKIPFLPGSGIFHRAADTLKAYIATTLYSTLFNYEDQHSFFAIMSAKAFDEYASQDSIDHYFHSQKFSAILENAFQNLCTTPSGHILTFYSNQEIASLKADIKDVVSNIFYQHAPSIFATVTTDSAYSPDQFHSDITNFINYYLNLISVDQIAQLMKDCTEGHSSDLVFWANLCGMFGGLARVLFGFIRLQLNGKGK